jgi:uncharacterized membrane-anchored protein
MSYDVIFGMLLLPNVESLLPALPALAIMLAIALVIGLYGRAPMTSPAQAFAKLGMGGKVALVIGAQALLLIGFAAKYEMVLADAQTITLKTMPYDPFDPFRGNYFSFRYDISELNSNAVAFENSKPFYEGEVVYVTLRKDIPDWKPVSVSDRLPQLPDGEVALKGIVRTPGLTNLSLHYGLEQYFYSDENKPNITSKAIATAKVNRNGDAVLTNLVPLPQEPTQRRFHRNTQINERSSLFR